MKPFLLLFGLLFVVPATGQEHAPTAGQCQADLAVWGDSEMLTQYLNARVEFMEKGTADGTNVNKLGWKEVTARMSEMSDCSKVDPQGIERYLETASFYEKVMGDRLGDFVMRHNLWDRFVLEDSQGRR